MKIKMKALYQSLIAIPTMLFSNVLLAAPGGGGGSSSEDLGAMASQITSSFSNVALLITGLSYLAGLGFSIGAILKFKQHKDNPTQIPIGTPIALILVAAALLFLPSILGVTGATMFSDAQVAGPGGTLFGTSD